VQSGPDSVHPDLAQHAIPEHAEAAHRSTRGKEFLMLDIVMLALGFGFFAAGIGYAYACERL
jgi:hypothetical protein